MTGRHPLVEKNKAPACISGMHRSGTSTVAQLLYRCGLYLGDESDLFTGGPGNPDGFWENRRFVEINEQILKEQGGGWDIPPTLPPDWQQDDAFLSYKVEAERLLEGFRGREPWGWKDPRNSLTLPFWLELMPEMRIVVCIRNPLEVAGSLRKRGNSSIALGLSLWKTYNEHLLETVPEGQYMVTHYDAYFYRPQQEMRRVLDFLGIPASDQLISLVRSRVVRGLRTHYFTLADLLEADPSREVRDLYLKMCGEAAWEAEPRTTLADPAEAAL